MSRTSGRTAIAATAIAAVIPLVCLVPTLVSETSASAQAVVYRPPVDAPVVDPFRAPSSPFGPGNRGLEYATVPGTVVRAIGPGRVSFVGPVAGTLYVTVLHADGLRSSYGRLRSTSARVGDIVAAGGEIGRSGPRLHLGVRRGDDYLDPESLFSLAPPQVRLVPVGDPEPGRRVGAAVAARLVTR